VGKKKKLVYPPLVWCTAAPREIPYCKSGLKKRENQNLSKEKYFCVSPESKGRKRDQNPKEVTHIKKQTSKLRKGQLKIMRGGLKRTSGSEGGFQQPVDSNKRKRTKKKEMEGNPASQEKWGERKNWVNEALPRRKQKHSNLKKHKSLTRKPAERGHRG